MTFEEWKKLLMGQWCEIWSNYVVERRDPSPEELKEWYWKEVGCYKKPRKGIGSL